MTAYEEWIREQATHPVKNVLDVLDVRFLLHRLDEARANLKEE